MSYNLKHDQQIFVNGQAPCTGMAVLYYDLKQVIFDCFFPKCWLIWVKFGRDLLLHKIHRWVQFYPEWW